MQPKVVRWHRFAIVINVFWYDRCAMITTSMAMKMEATTPSARERRNGGNEQRGRSAHIANADKKTAAELWAACSGKLRKS